MSVPGGRVEIQGALCSCSVRAPAPPAQFSDCSPRTTGPQPRDVLRLAARFWGRFGRGAKPPSEELEVLQQAALLVLLAGAARARVVAPDLLPVRGPRLDARGRTRRSRRRRHVRSGATALLPLRSSRCGR